MVALGLALGASIAWGGSDFLAGLVTRRLPVLTVLALSQGFGLVLVLALLALAALVPVATAAMAGELPTPGVVAGLALALAGGVLVALEPRQAGASRRRVAPGAALALLAALGFGAFFVAIDVAANEGGVAWAVSVNRATSFAALIVVIAIGRRIGVVSAWGGS